MATEKPCAAAESPAPADFDVAIFDREVELLAVRVPSRRVGDLKKNSEVKELLYKQRGIPNVLPVQDDPKSRLLLLKQSASSEQDDTRNQENLPGEMRSLLASGEAVLMRHKVHLGYEHVSAEEALERLLPAGLEVPRSFETVGHVAHFNLRDQQLPHRFLVGRVILDKNPGIKTVVTKVGKLSNEFRTFHMEVIGGQDNTDVSVSESGLRLKFNFRDVYWNSRLSHERTKLLQMVEQEDIVCDLFAGIGAFALLCSGKGCQVFANDLNPAGAEAMRRNAELNKLRLNVFNLDARACVIKLGSLPPPPQASDLGPSQKLRVHVIMNLPELALDFLDAFREMVSSGQSALFSGTPLELRVHCHCFARSKEKPEEEVNPRIQAALGTIPDGTVIREVRDVAPNKNMFCVEFAVPLSAGAVAAAASPAETRAESEAPCKRARPGEGPPADAVGNGLESGA